MKCDHCHKLEHLKRDCFLLKIKQNPEFKKWKPGKASSISENDWSYTQILWLLKMIVLNRNVLENSRLFMTSRREWFNSYKDFDGWMVYMRNNHSCQIRRIMIIIGISIDSYISPQLYQNIDSYIFYQALKWSLKR